ncbi:MAG: type II toxin-antitoxin system MqsR family toxin [Deltaproteobacteria bacterium]|nr:type II toxin-antitoxin system MqsR family toxin [Deltaproteobacteria bacterium]
MASQGDVNKFLGNFKQIVTQRGIWVVQREKNVNTQIELGFNNVDVQKEILRLDCTHYVDGPKPDRDRQGDVWEFGKIIEHEEVYIKVKLTGGVHPVCISFHFAEEPIGYPFQVRKEVTK